MMNNNDVLDIAQYIIYCSLKKNFLITHLKLQKLLYFVQAYFLIITGKPAFYDPIYADGNIPIVERVYEEYGQYGDIDMRTLNLQIYDSYILDKETKQAINDVINLFKNDISVKMGLIIGDQKPFKEAAVLGERNEISIRSMKKYFKN